MVKKKTQEPKEPGMLGAVLFSDGSALPNPGYAGWGLHGYIYEATEPTKGTGNPDYVLTENNYLSKTEKATLPNIALVTPLHYVDAYSAMPNYPSTNNAGELAGTIEGLRLAIEHDVKKLRIWSDSEYVVKGSVEVNNWQRSGWRLASGAEPKNLNLWKEFVGLIDILKEKGVDYLISWNRGHAGNFGNEIADSLAFVGMRHATQGILDKSVILKSPDGYWKYDTDRHPFINHRRMYYNTLAESNKPGVYCLGEHDKDDDLAGKRMANGAYAYVCLDEPEKVLETVREYSCAVAGGEDNVMIARVDYIYKGETHDFLYNYGPVILNNPPEAESPLDAVIRNKKEPVTLHHYPPFLIARCENELVQLKDILEDFQRGNTDQVITDITSLIYESIETPSKKGEIKQFTKLRPEFIVGTSKMSAMVNYRHPDNTIHQTQIDLLLGLDLLDRNALRRIEEMEPIVKVVTWSEEPSAFRFATIIQVKGAIGIWSGAYSNLRLILN